MPPFFLSILILQEDLSLTLSYSVGKYIIAQ